ncbi:hypothetical protein ACJ41O_012323 [Fusarium nematophilum]
MENTVVKHQTLTLAHEKEEGTDIDTWHRTLDQAATKDAAQRIVIQSIPFYEDVDSNTRIDHDIKKEWEDNGGFRNAFQRAIARIPELPQLNAVHVRFSDKCCGIASEKDWWVYGECETRAERMETLRTVFSALEQRVDNPRNSAVRCLAIENLQNTPVPELIHTDTFKAAVSGVQELHLSVCTEYNEHGPDRDIYKEERCTFEPFLQQVMLPTMADNLTHLTLKFDQEWGSLPGQFDGRNLSFPKLESLVLENYIIGHHDQLDWVLSQKTLKSLSLVNPRIVSHVRVDGKDVETWRLRTDDWKRWPQGAFGFEGGDDTVFSFLGTWEAVFDSIRIGLLNLVDFRLSDSPRYGHEIVNEISPLRYIVFNIGLLPSPWIEGEDDGEFEFAEYCSEDEEDERVQAELETLKSATKHKYVDKRALDDLLRAVEERK